MSSGRTNQKPARRGLALQFTGGDGAEIQRPDPKRAKPNIILIYADDLDFDEISPYNHVKFPSYTGAKKLGYYRPQNNGLFIQNDKPLPRGEQGYFNDPRMLTPNIDRLAKEGAVFERFYITTSICTPSRYSLLTGRYASRSPSFCETHKPCTHGNIQWNTFVSPEETNIAKALKNSGYTTAIVGKWHNFAPRAIAKDIPNNANPHDPEINARIKEAYKYGVRYLNKEIGFDHVDRIYFQNKEFLGVPDTMKAHNPEWITEGALNFIEKNTEKPFFLYLPITLPHGQYYSGALNENPLATPAGMLGKAPDTGTSRTDIIKRLQEKGIDERNATATWIDDGVGAVLKKIKELGIENNTVIIFTSDHQSRGKFTCYEGCRVPFIMRWPSKIKPGTRVNDICANIDVAATLIEIAGGQPPDDMVKDGRSFVPLLRKRRHTEWRDALMLECSNIRAVVTEKWKYIANRPPAGIRKKMEKEAMECASAGKKRRISWHGTENWHNDEEGVIYGADRDFPHYFDYDQLYNLENDIYEQKNLANEPEYSGILREMKKRLKDELKTLPHIFGEFKEK
ncbi:sulfatase [Verrucomicrobiota bacterium]